MSNIYIVGNMSKRMNLPENSVGLEKFFLEPPVLSIIQNDSL